MKSDIRIFLLPVPRLNFSLNFIKHFAEPLSLLGRPSQISIQGFFWRFSLSLNECTTFWSRYLFPFDCTLKIVGITDSLSKFAPVSWMPERLSTDSWSRHFFQRRAPKDLNIVGTLLAAVCLLLLVNAENLPDPLWWRLWKRRHGTGNVYNLDLYQHSDHFRRYFTCC